MAADFKVSSMEVPLQEKLLSQQLSAVRIVDPSVDALTNTMDHGIVRPPGVLRESHLPSDHVPLAWKVSQTTSGEKVKKGLTGCSCSDSSNFKCAGDQR